MTIQSLTHNNTIGTTGTPNLNILALIDFENLSGQDTAERKKKERKKDGKK